MRILVIEDHEELAELVGKGLDLVGFQSDRAPTANVARQLLSAHDYSLLVLDLGLPGEDGLDFLRLLRRDGLSVPILVTTARSRVEERVAGLSAGADDYLIKPFAFSELVARIEAILRRPPKIEERVLEAGNVVVNAREMNCVVGGVPCLLSSREMTLLISLIRRKGRVVAKSALEDDICQLGAEVSSNAIEVYIHRLRKLLSDAGASVAIDTVRGVGYVLRVLSS